MPDMLAANRAAGHVAFSVEARNGATRRARVHECGPLRVRCPGPPGHELEAMMLNTAGGMAGGDCFQIDLSIGRDAHLLVTTAAAEKVYRSLGNETKMNVTVDVAAAGTLAWLPQETIFFDGARLSRSIEVDLAATAQLLLVESVVFGRSGMGEVVKDGTFFDRRRIRRDGKLIHAESFELGPPIAKRLAQRAVANGAIGIANIVLTPADEATVAVARDAARCLGSEVGASTWNGIAIVRIVSADGGTLRKDLLALLTAIRGRALPRILLN
jgi:urease accessory protein